MYHLQLFGPLQLTGPHGVLFGGSSRPLQLLLFACLSRRPRSAAAIAGTLWPHAEQSSRQHSFRQAFYKLNKAAPGLIRVSNQRVVPNRAILTTDIDLIRACEERGDTDALLDVVRGEFIPGCGDTGVAFAHWVDAQRAEHWTPLIGRIRRSFRELAKSAEWQEILRRHNRLQTPLADDPFILGVAIRSSIYTAESATLRRDIGRMIRQLPRRNHAQASRLERLLNRRLRWDQHAKVHVGPFVGRAHELRVFAELHKTAGGAQGFLCCISGSIGMGKSRTAKQFARIAAIRGSRIRTVHLALDQPNSNYAKVARALKELEKAKHNPVSSPLPVLLVIDDFDWAGPACANLLLGLVATLSETPSLGIVITAKDSSLVQRLLASAPAGTKAVHLRLRRFDEAERKQLLNWLGERHSLSDDDLRKIDDDSSGVPAYAHRLARRPRDSTVYRQHLPDVTLAEIRRLVPGALRLFALVSFCGGTVHANALAAALELAPEELHRLASRLVDLGLLECRSHQQFEAADQCAGDTIQREFDLAELRQLGARVALETAAVSRLDAARIANRIGDIELESRCYFESAREAIGFGAYSDAETLLSRCSSTAADRRLSARADFWQAEIHLRLRRYEEALGAYALLLASPHLLSTPMLTVAKARHAQVLSMISPELASAAFDVTEKLPVYHLRQVAPKALAEVLLASAAIAIVSGEAGILSRIADRIESELDDSPTNLRWLELAATLCRLRLQIDGFSSVLPLCNRYMTRARLSGLPAEMASTLLTAAIVNTAAGRLSEAEQLYREVNEIVRQNRLLGFSHILTSNFAVALLEMGNSHEAIGRLQALREKDAKIGVGYYLAFDDLNLATAFFEQGDLDSAARHASEALSRKCFFPNAEYGTALAIEGIAAMHRGDVAEAVHLMEEIDAAGQRWGDLSYSAMLKASIIRNQEGSEPAVQHLLAAARSTTVTYRPAAIRLRLFAAEIEAACNPLEAADIARACALEAASCGMQAVRLRAAQVIGSAIS